MEKPRFNFLKWALVLSIVVVLNLFVHYSISAVYPEPLFETYCKQEQVTKILDTEAQCVSAGGAWSENQYYPEKMPRPVTLDQPAGYCDTQFTCRKGYESANDIYRRNVFVARVILGVVAIVIAFMVPTAQAVSLGFSFGGALSFIIATTAYWSKLGQYLQVIVLALALGVLIWLGVKKIKD